MTGWLALLALVGHGTPGPLADQLPLHLRQAAEEGQDKPPVWCGGVQRLRDRAKDVSDLYERHDLAAYLDSDAELLRKYLGEQRHRLEVVRG